MTFDIKDLRLIPATLLLITGIFGSMYGNNIISSILLSLTIMVSIIVNIVDKYWKHAMFEVFLLITLMLNVPYLERYYNW